MRWRSKQDAKAAERILVGLTEKARVEDGKLVFSLPSMTQVQAGFSFLSSSIVMSEKVPEVKRDAFVSAAVSELVSKDLEGDADAFLRAVERAQRNYLKIKPVDFVVLSRLSMRLPPNLRRIRRLGTTHVFSQNPPRGFTRPDKALGQERAQLNDESAYCWVRTMVSARDVASAGEIGTDRLDEWRGIWNYALTYGRARFSMHPGYFPPVNPIVVGPVHTVHNLDGKPASDAYWWEPAHVESVKLCNVEKDVSRLVRLDLIFRRQRVRLPLGRDLSRIIIRYVRALDERDMESAFLKLWGVLELATNTTLNTYEVTVRRAASIWKDRAQAKAVLQHLRNRRNDLVHHGQAGTNAETVLFALKPYVDELVGRLTGNGHHFADLSEFASYLDLLADPDSLPRKQRLIRLAIRAR
jgi:hypothetical protein